MVRTKPFEPRIVVMSPDGDPVFNYKNQTNFFPNYKAAEQGVKDELEEAEEDGEDAEWTEKDYRYFREVL